MSDDYEDFVENQVELALEQELAEALDNVPNETKNEAFLRLVNKRLPVAVKRLRLLKNLAGAAYDYSPQQAGQVVAVIRTELEDLERAFFAAQDEDDIPTIE